MTNAAGFSSSSTTRPSSPEGGDVLVGGLQQKLSHRISRLTFSAGVAWRIMLVFFGGCALRLIDKSGQHSLSLSQLSGGLVVVLYVVALAAVRELFRCHELSRMLKLAYAAKARHGSLSVAETHFLLAMENRRLSWVSFCVAGGVMMLGAATVVSVGVSRWARYGMTGSGSLHELTIALAIAVGVVIAALGMGMMGICAVRGLRRWAR